MKGMNKIMKKTLPLILGMSLLCCTLTACGDKDNNSSEPKTTEANNATENHSSETSVSESETNTSTESATDNRNNNNNNGNIVTKAGDVVDDLVSTGEDIVDDAGSVVEDAGDAILGTDNNRNR